MLLIGMMIATQKDIGFSRILKGPEVIADGDDRERNDDEQQESHDRQAPLGSGSAFERRP